MMPDLARLYDDAFFAEWGNSHPAYVEGARLIANVLVDEFRPARMVDLGCGCGVYSHWLAQRGVETVAIDGVRPPSAYSFPVDVQIQDLTVPFENRWGRFDAALCLEVAEHIPATFTPVFLANITQFSDLLLLSGAPPGQGGHHHVNEQPKRYWITQLAERGFLYDRPKTGQLMEIFKRNKPPMMWMSEHISVYRKAAGPAEIKRFVSGRKL